jgi:uncharacterized protein Veg
MKRKFLCAVAAIAALTGLLAACGSGEVDKEILNNISDLRTNVYTAKSESVEVTVLTGRRETPYKIDGISEVKTDYTVISIKPAEPPSPERSYSYTLVNGKNKYGGEFTPHPFGATYTAEIARQLTGEATLTVTSDQLTEELTLEPHFEAGMLEWDEALAKGVSAVQDEVRGMYVDGKLNAEVYVQFIGDPLQNGGGYFWYIAVSGQNGKTYAALLDPVTGEILASKKS